MLTFATFSILLMGCASAAPVSVPHTRPHLLGLGHKTISHPTYQRCTQNGRNGQLIDGLCVLPVDIDIAARDGPVGDRGCKLTNGAPGVWQYGVCVRAGTEIHKKDLLNLNQGQACDGARGSGYWDNGYCIPILEGVVDIQPQQGIGREPSLDHHHARPIIASHQAKPLIEATPCWHQGKYGYLKHNDCVFDELVDITLTKRLHTNLFDGDNEVLSGPVPVLGDKGYRHGFRPYHTGYYDDDDVVFQIGNAVAFGDLLVRSDYATNEERAVPLLDDKLAGPERQAYGGLLDGNQLIPGIL